MKLDFVDEATEVSEIEDWSPPAFLLGYQEVG